MTPLEILTKTRMHIADPSRWTNADALAVNAKGEHVSERDPSAVAWSMMGAYHFVSHAAVGPLAALPEQRYMAHYRGVAILRHVCASEQLRWWQSTSERTHADVLRVLDEAIKRASAGV